jgi:hypothetical protein
MANHITLSSATNVTIVPKQELQSVTQIEPAKYIIQVDEDGNVRTDIFLRDQRNPLSNIGGGDVAAHTTEMQSAINSINAVIKTHVESGDGVGYNI